MNKYGVPRIAFVKQDGPRRREFPALRGADPNASARQPGTIQLPMGAEDGFVVCDLVKMKSIWWMKKPRA